MNVRRSTFNVQRSTCRAIAGALLDWFANNARDLPWRHTLDPYAVWVSEIMLQQTQVATVIPYYERWQRELPTLAALAGAPEPRVLKLWEGLGYYSRARNLQKAAQAIVRTHGDTFPRDFDAILALPGVGRYTAGAIASIAFNQPRPILDGNVIRVLCRLFALRENPRAKETSTLLWCLAEQLVTTAATLDLSPLPSPLSPLQFSGSCSALNQSLMELGATVCTPRSPNCAACPLRARCAARKLDLTDTLPNLAPRAAATERLFHTFIVTHAGRILVGQRPGGGVNAGLWEFPNIEITDAPCEPSDSAARCLGITGTAPEKLTTLRHAITRYRITQEVFTVTLESQGAEKNGRRTKKARNESIQLSRTVRAPGPEAPGSFRVLSFLSANGRDAVEGSGAGVPPHRWFEWDDLHALAFTGPHRKLLRKLEQARSPVLSPAPAPA